MEIGLYSFYIKMMIARLLHAKTEIGLHARLRENDSLPPWQA